MFSVQFTIPAEDAEKLIWARDVMQEFERYTLHKGPKPPMELEDWATISKASNVFKDLKSKYPTFDPLKPFSVTKPQPAPEPEDPSIFLTSGPKKRFSQ